MHPVPWSIGKSCGGRWKGAPSSPEAERKKLSICSCSIRRACRWPDCAVDLKLRGWWYKNYWNIPRQFLGVMRVCYFMTIEHNSFAGASLYGALQIIHFRGKQKRLMIHGGAPPFDGHVSTCFARHVLLNLSAIIKFASPLPLQATSSSSSCSSILFSSFHFSILPESTLASQRHRDLCCWSIICANGTKLV